MIVDRKSLADMLIESGMTVSYELINEQLMFLFVLTSLTIHKFHGWGNHSP